ncbi:conserved hypothetical protein [Roseibium sp. TrichSKD4]|uniref:hypothetical protein n=1 Tax=Roseibium sp. TrichSKD4 TaxID=744980 RepID=UPI0001E56AEE|nr:hypothetical protein [Roseibium sp. TrichSKD4]EFO32566.1 conserved hypothetical protein [Roseibium sp. TrichSKD4]
MKNNDHHTNSSHGFEESANRKAAKKRLICGGECHGAHGDIIDLGNGVSHCAKCPLGELAREAAALHVKKTGKNTPLVEVILPAPRKTAGYWKHLYFDLLHKHASVLEELEQLKG